LLALEPGATLASISTWADETRNKTTAPWHYVNFPRDKCIYDAARDCPDGQCVVGAIDKQLAVLASNASDDKRLVALKYIVHLVADIHQPLHAGYADDRGGNTSQVQAFGRGTNLHALWDSGLIENMRLDAAAMTTKLQAMPVAAGYFDAARVAEESCRIVGAPGFYPERKIGVDYVERFGPVMEQRLAAAGARLAAILNVRFK
jgi:nuclease S1